MCNIPIVLNTYRSLMHREITVSVLESEVTCSSEFILLRCFS